MDNYDDDSINIIPDDLSATSNNNNNGMTQDLALTLAEVGFEAGDFDVTSDQLNIGIHNTPTTSSDYNAFGSSTGYVANGVNANVNNDHPHPSLPSSVRRGPGLREWHSEDDLQKRMEMTHRIMRLLQERKRGPCNKSWLQELPHKALRLEKHLYKAAPSLESYMDETTLKHRLRKCANAISTHLRLKKANDMQHKMDMGMETNNLNSNNNTNVDRNTSNNQHMMTMDHPPPPVSQVITTHNVNIDDTSTTTTSPSPNNSISQTVLLPQMLEMQKSLNDLMRTSSMNNNGGRSLADVQQLQQQMFEMQSQLNQLTQQAMNGNISSNSVLTSQITSMGINNNADLNLLHSATAQTAQTLNNDEELDIEFLQGIF